MGSSSNSRTATVDYISVTVTYTPVPLYFRSVATGLWSATSTWQQSTDNATWVAATKSPSSSDVGITIRTGDSVTVASAVSIDQTTVEAGGKLTVTSTLTVANGTGTDLTMNGAMNVTGTLTTSAGSTVVNNGGILKNSGTVTGTSSTLSFGSGSKYQHNYTTSAGTVPTATWNSNSTCEIVGYTNTSLSTCPDGMAGQTLGHFIWNCPNQTALISSSNELNYVAGDLTVATTGTGSWWLSQRTDNAYLSVTGNVTLTAGNFFMDSSGANRHVLIGGNLVQNGGTLTVTKCVAGDPGDMYLGVNGNLSINAGTFRNLNTGTAFDSIVVKGNWTNAGTFTAGRSVAILNGSSAQTLTGATSFKNLTINNASGITLNNNATVDSILTLTSGNVTTGANSMVIGTSGRMARTSGHIVGNLQMYFATGAVEKAFYLGTSDAYTPATVAITGTGGTAGTITGSTTGSAHPQIASSGLDTDKDIARYWTLTPGSAALGARTYTLRTRFASADVPAGATPANFEMRHYNGSAWNDEPTGTYTRTDTSTQVSGLASFSDFVVGEQASAAVTAAPVVSSPIAAGATSVSGTSTEADGTTDRTVCQQRNGRHDHGFIRSVDEDRSDGTVAGNLVKATATASGKLVSA